MAKDQTFKHRTSGRRLGYESLEPRQMLAGDSYFVDSQLGDDGNSGTSSEEAWASLNRVESASLQPGDTVFFKRGDSWNDHLSINDTGSSAAPIVFSAYGTGDAPIIERLTIYGSHTRFENLTIDHDKQASDAVRIRNAQGVTLKNMEIRNGIQDGIDAVNADGLLIEDLYIHHFLAGSFTNQADAHGIVMEGTQNPTIRGTEISHVSGDSIQTDPARNLSDLTNDILVENSHFWTSPLDVDFNDQWKMGERPGENAIDTKVSKNEWDIAERMRLTIRNVTAHGWEPDGFIGNRAAFNLKEKIEVTLDGVTVYDSEIAFRLRGTRGNANVTILNTVIYDVVKAIRAEDNLSNLKVYNTTFGDGIQTQLQFAGGSGGTGSWDWQNNAFIGTKPSIASDPSNKVATAADFVDAANRDYHLATGSGLIDAGANLGEVTFDREGTSRPQGSSHDVGAYETVIESADFDTDNDIDGQDFLIWQRGFGTTGSDLHDQGDSNFDGTIDDADLNVWQEQFGSSPSIATTINPPSLRFSTTDPTDNSTTIETQISDNSVALFLPVSGNIPAGIIVVGASQLATHQILLHPDANDAAKDAAFRLTQHDAWILPDDTAWPEVTGWNGSNDENSSPTVATDYQLTDGELDLVWMGLRE